MTVAMELAWEVAARTANAHSCARYGRSWGACARALVRAGWTPAQAETILRSKLPRWAADQGGKPYGRATARDLMAYLPTVPETLRALVGTSQPVPALARLEVLLAAQDRALDVALEAVAREVVFPALRARRWRLTPQAGGYIVRNARGVVVDADEDPGIFRLLDARVRGVQVGSRMPAFNGAKGGR